MLIDSLRPLASSKPLSQSNWTRNSELFLVALTLGSMQTNYSIILHGASSISQSAVQDLLKIGQKVVVWTPAMKAVTIKWWIAWMAQYLLAKSVASVEVLKFEITPSRKMSISAGRIQSKWVGLSKRLAISLLVSTNSMLIGNLSAAVLRLQLWSALWGSGRSRSRTCSTWATSAQRTSATSKWADLMTLAKRRTATLSFLLTRCKRRWTNVLWYSCKEALIPKFLQTIICDKSTKTM